MAWYGDSKAHAAAGRLGGKAQGKRNNPGNFANDREKAKRAGRKGGSAKVKQEPVMAMAETYNTPHFTQQ